MAKKSMILKQQRDAKFSTRKYNRCKICGRPHAYLRNYGICRICFREPRISARSEDCAIARTGRGSPRTEFYAPRFMNGRHSRSIIRGSRTSMRGTIFPCRETAQTRGEHIPHTGQMQT